MPETRIGLIYPSDGVLDREFWSFAPPGVSVHITRAIVPDCPVDLAFVARHVDDPDIDRGAESFRTIRPAAVAYACTSVSFARGTAGDRSIRERIAAASGAPATTTSAALVAACRALGLRRVAVAAPYVGEISRLLGDFLDEHDIVATDVTQLGLTGGIGDVTTEAVVQLGIDADTPDAEGLVISCTNLPTLEAIPVLEAALEKPVVTANQATVWHACELAGVPRPAAGVVGRLWRGPLADAAE
jgi:maleate isomerase